MQMRTKRFESNREMIMSDEGYEVELPDFSQFPIPIKEIFKFIERYCINGCDLVGLQEGETSE